MCESLQPCSLHSGGSRLSAGWTPGRWAEVATDDPEVGSHQPRDMAGFPGSFFRGFRCSLNAGESEDALMVSLFSEQLLKNVSF